MRLSTFTHDFLLLFAGPLVWSLHFVGIYGLAGIVCAREGEAARWMGWPWDAWALVLAGVVAAGVLLPLLRARPRSTHEDSRRFVRWTSRALAGLALLAIAWETLAVLLVPTCSDLP